MVDTSSPAHPARFTSRLAAWGFPEWFVPTVTEWGARLLPHWSLLGGEGFELRLRDAEGIHLLRLEYGRYPLGFAHARIERYLLAAAMDEDLRLQPNGQVLMDRGDRFVAIGESHEIFGQISVERGAEDWIVLRVRNRFPGPARGFMFEIGFNRNAEFAVGLFRRPG